MKTIPIALAAHIALGSTTLAWALKITRTDAEVFAFTSAADDVTLSSVIYSSAPGLDITGVVINAGLAVDNLELTTLDDGTTFSRDDVLAGRWNNAAFQIARYNWASPSDGVDVVMVGTVGDARLHRGSISIELRGLQQYLQQPVGAVTSKTCRAHLGDTLCTVDLGPFIVTGTLTGVTSRQVVTDSARAEATGYFDEGVLTWTGGANDGLSQKVKTFASGAITLALPMIGTPLIGDTYSMVAGCQKRLAEDCFTKFNNVLNFQGEPHLPGVDKVMEVRR